MKNNKNLTPDDPYLAELDNYSVYELMGAMETGSLPNIGKKSAQEAVAFIVLNKRPIGAYRIPFSGGMYNIFLYKDLEGIVATYSGPALPGHSKGYRHIHEFMAANPSLSGEPEFQRMAQETGFSIKPSIIPFTKPKGH